MGDGSLTQEEINILLAEDTSTVGAEPDMSLTAAELEILFGKPKEKEKVGSEVLSQDEIDSLLEAIREGETPDYSYRDFGKPKVKIYDFRRPDTFNKIQIRSLQLIHERFARSTSLSLSAATGVQVRLYIGSVDQLTYEEFIRSIPNPATLAIINMDPLRGSAILELDPLATFSILDCITGGDGHREGIQKMTRGLTDLEMSLMESVVVRLLGNLREAWGSYIDLRPRLGNIENNPLFANIAQPNDMCVMITMEAMIGDNQTMINLCIPASTIAPIAGKLKIHYEESVPSKNIFDDGRVTVPLSDIPIRLHASHRDVFLKFDDFLNLEPGDVIPLGAFTLGDSHHPIVLKHNGEKLFDARTEWHGDRLAARILLENGRHESDLSQDKGDGKETDTGDRGH